MERDVQIAGISVDSLEDSKELAADEGYAFALVSDPERKLIQAFGVDDPGNEIAWPAVILVMEDGTVAYKHVTDNYKHRPSFEAVSTAIDEAIAAQKPGG